MMTTQKTDWEKWVAEQDARDHWGEWWSSARKVVFRIAIFIAIVTIGVTLRGGGLSHLFN